MCLSLLSQPAVDSPPETSLSCSAHVPLSINTAPLSFSTAPPAPLPPCADAFPQSYLSYSMQKIPFLGPSQPPWPKPAPTASRKGLSEAGEKCSLALVSNGTVKAPLEPCLAEHLGPASPSSYPRVWRVERHPRAR